MRDAIDSAFVSRVAKRHIRSGRVYYSMLYRTGCVRADAPLADLVVAKVVRVSNFVRVRDQGRGV